jgi:hypothetical protein
VFSAQQHPEFGYFCPSSRVRRVFGAVLVIGLVGLIAGLGSMRSMLEQDSDSEESVMPAYTRAAVVPEPAVPAQASAPLRSPTQVPGLPASKTDPAKDPAKACEEMTWAYLDGKCVAGKTRKPRVVRVPTHRPAIALIPLGRTGSSGTDISASKAANAAGTADAKSAPSKATKAAAAESSTSADSPLQAFAATKKPQRTARNRTHRRSRVADRGYRFGWRGTAQAMGYSGWSW